MEHNTLSWEAKEFSYSSKKTDWYWSVGLVSALVAMFALYFGNLLFAVLAVIAGAAIMLEGARTPARIRYSLTKQGVRAGSRFFPFDAIANYAIDDRLNHLVLTTRAPLAPQVDIPLDSTNPESVRALLKGKIPETEPRDSVGDILARRIGL